MSSSSWKLEALKRHKLRLEQKQEEPKINERVQRWVLDNQSSRPVAVGKEYGQKKNAGDKDGDRYAGSVWKKGQADGCTTRQCTVDDVEHLKKRLRAGFREPRNEQEWKWARGQE